MQAKEEIMSLDKSQIIAIIGAGAMGAGIAQVTAIAGHKILLNDIDVEAAKNALKSIEKRILRLVEKGRLSDIAAQSAIANLNVASNLAELAPAKLVVEAAVERLDIKRDIFKQLENICSDDTILSTNTSSLSINSIASGMTRPQNIVGLHFFNPAPIMKLVEIVSGLETDPKIAETLYNTAKAWGKIPVHAKSTPGFIVNRVARSFYGEALNVLGENAASAATIDCLLKSCGGFRMGPIELVDLIGHDVNYAVSCSVYDAYYQDARFKPSLLQKALVDSGRLGRKSGHGFYKYGADVKQAEAEIAKPQEAPIKFRAYATRSFNHNMLPLLQKCDIEMELVEDQSKRGLVLPCGVHVLFTRGKLATEEAQLINAPVVLMDLSSDYVNCSHIAIAASDDCSIDQLNQVTGLLQKLGKKVCVIDDIAGMIVMRSIAMLANEAADAVNQNVASVKDVDLAMKNGVNYPKGPLEWADEIGIAYLVNVLRNIETVYGETRYRVSPLMQRKALAGAKFYD